MATGLAIARDPEQGRLLVAIASNAGVPEYLRGIGGAGEEGESDRGGAPPPYTAGGAGLQASAPTEVTRCALKGGSGPVPGQPYNGTVLDMPDLVGMTLDHGLVRGQTSTATATAGGSGQALAVFLGLDLSTTTDPLMAGPLFGTQSGLTLLSITTPAAGGTVSTALAIPNSAVLFGAAAWVQALQLDRSGTWQVSPPAGGVVL